ncbi:MAG: hypothetical protein DRQ02_01345 [Candidatus Latescibacterota bacterium]|nr:MAG: hypothetical protein DRQ02_01345 [Candidatus Latescibacterota bacterium]
MLRDIVLHFSHAIDDVKGLPVEQWVGWALFVIESLEADVGGPEERLILLREVEAEVSARANALEDQMKDRIKSDGGCGY